LRVAKNARGVAKLSSVRLLVAPDRLELSAGERGSRRYLSESSKPNPPNPRKKFQRLKTLRPRVGEDVLGQSKKTANHPVARNPHIAINQD